MRTIHVIAGIAVFAAIATGCSQHNAGNHAATRATASHTAVHATAPATTPTRARATHTAPHSATTHHHATATPTPDPYVSYTQNDAYMNVPPWDEQQAKEFAGKLCTPGTARTDDLATDRQTVQAGIFTDTEMQTNLSNLLRAYCPTQRAAVLAQYTATS